jgi:hypothetical protein
MGDYEKISRLLIESLRHPQGSNLEMEFVHGNFQVFYSQPCQQEFEQAVKAMLEAKPPDQPEHPCEECNDHKNIGIADGLYIDCPKCTGKKGGA